AETGLLAHDCIDCRKVGDTLLSGFKALDVHATPAVVHDETRHILGPHGRMAHATRQFHQSVTKTPVASCSVDDLDHLHQGHRVEEVVADHPFRLAATRGYRRDGQRRCIRRQYAFRGNDVLKLAEKIYLDVEPFNDGLDDEISVGHVLECIGRDDALQ